MLSFAQAKILVILGCLCLSHEKSPEECKPGLTDHEKNVICSKAVHVNGFCCAAGPADKGCKEMAESVSGSDPKCASPNMCTFKKGGETVELTSKDDPKLNTVQDCMRSVRIVGGGGGGGGGDNKGANPHQGGGGGNPPPHNGGGGGGGSPPPHNGGGGGGGGGNPPPHNGGGGGGGSPPAYISGGGGGGGGGNKGSFGAPPGMVNLADILEPCKK